MSHYVALRFEAAGRYKPTVPIKVSTASSSEVKDNECYQRTGNDDSKGVCGVDWERVVHSPILVTVARRTSARAGPHPCAIVVYICSAGKNHVAGVACDARDIGDA